MTVPEATDTTEQAKPVRPVITVDPRVNFGEPSVRGVAVDVLASRLWAGDEVESLAEDYNLTRAQVILACWYVARHDRPLWRNRWRGWLKQVEQQLWHGRYDDVPPPPKGLVR